MEYARRAIVGAMRTCENCDRPDDDVLAVHRVYLDPDRGQPLEVLEELEWWCFSCRSQYPHEPAE